MSQALRLSFSKAYSSLALRFLRSLPFSLFSVSSLTQLRRSLLSSRCVSQVSVGNLRNLEREALPMQQFLMDQNLLILRVPWEALCFLAVLMVKLWFLPFSLQLMLLWDFSLLRLQLVLYSLNLSSRLLFLDLLEFLGVSRFSLLSLPSLASLLSLLSLDLWLGLAWVAECLGSLVRFWALSAVRMRLAEAVMSLLSKLKQSRLTGQGILTLRSRYSALLIQPTQEWHLISFTPARCPSLWLGSFTSSCRTRSLRLSLKATSSGNSTSSQRMRSLVSFSGELQAQKGGHPTTISQRSAPRQQQSTSKECPALATISGLMYSRLPQQEQRFCLLTLARPKSAMRRWPLRSIMMFSGLRSRQRMSRACRYSMASSTSMKYLRASSSVKRTTFRWRWNSSPPGQQSSTITQNCSVSRNSRMWTRKGKAMRSLTWRSLAMRSSLPRTFSFSINLAAQKAPSRRSRARYTLLKPPTPTHFSIRYASTPRNFPQSSHIATQSRLSSSRIHPSPACSLQSLSQSPLRLSKQIALPALPSALVRYSLTVLAGQGKGSCRTSCFWEGRWRVTVSCVVSALFSLERDLFFF